jgi:hypothetical protein
MYGLEGKRCSYEAHSCNTLKTQVVSHNNDVIKCPFVYESKVKLKELLKENGLTDSLINTILEVKKDLQCEKLKSILKHLNDIDNNNNLIDLKPKNEKVFKPSDFFLILSKNKKI